jgi:putative FmdB family regulatory protein
MPTYAYACTCGVQRDIVRMMKDHTPTIPCECGQDMRQKITAPRVIPDIQPYKSIVTGERIKCRAHHREHLREHNLVELGNEPIRERKHKPMPDVVPDLKRAYQELS